MRPTRWPRAVEKLLRSTSGRPRDAVPCPRMAADGTTLVSRHTAVGPAGRCTCVSDVSRLWSSRTSSTSVARTDSAWRITAAGVSARRSRNSELGTTPSSDAANSWLTTLPAPMPVVTTTSGVTSPR